MKILKIVYLGVFILFLALFLPRIIDTALGEAKKNPKVYFSENLNQFLIQGYDREAKKSYFLTESGDELSTESFMQNLPFKFYSYLLAKGIFPNQYTDWANADKIRANSQILAIKPSFYNQKSIPLFTILESKPKFLKLQFNNYGIRGKKDRIEFVNLETLKVDDKLSQTYTDALKQSGFIFPLKCYYSNPTTRKVFDEGAFLQDKQNTIFHLKMVNGKPLVKNTKIKNATIKKIIIKENQRKEFYGALIDDSGVKLISYDNYKLIPLPNSMYKPESMVYSLFITPLSKTVIINMDDKVEAYKLDNSYQILRNFSFPIENNNQWITNIKKYLLPFTLKRKDGYRYEYTLGDFSFLVLLANALFVLLYFGLTFKREVPILHFIIIGVFGIYGFIALCLY
jgi:hypothetical protein